MRTFLITALALAAVATSPAYAQREHYNPFPPATDGTRAVVRPATNDTEHDTLPTITWNQLLSGESLPYGVLPNGIVNDPYGQ